MRKLLINEKNWGALSKIEDRGDRMWEEALRCMSDVNRILEEELESDRVDWGSLYHSWLKNLGINPESASGWWSLAAVDPRNLEAFVQDYNDPDGLPGRDEAMAAITPILQAGTFVARSQIATEVIEDILGYSP